MPSKKIPLILLSLLLVCPCFCGEQLVSVFFSPPTDLNARLAEYIDNSTQSIKGCFYSVNNKKVASSLIKAHLRGVQIQIVMDESRIFEEDSHYPQLKNFGIVKKDVITKTLMHHKFCVIDEKLVWTGSYNPSPYALYTNNDALIIQSEELAGIYLQEFQKLWDAKPGSKDKKHSSKVKIDEGLEIEAYFSPEEGGIILKRLCEVLNGAKTSIYFAQFTVTHPDIAEILIKKDKDGLDVRGIMEYDQIDGYSQYKKFKQADVDVKQDKNYFFPFHHKFFIIDEKIVITGSLNPTKAGLNSNRENILFIQSSDLAQKYLRYFKNIR